MTDLMDQVESETRVIHAAISTGQAKIAAAVDAYRQNVQAQILAANEQATNAARRIDELDDQLATITAERDTARARVAELLAKYEPEPAIVVGVPKDRPPFPGPVAANVANVSELIRLASRSDPETTLALAPGKYLLPKGLNTTRGRVHFRSADPQNPAELIADAAGLTMLELRGRADWLVFDGNGRKDATAIVFWERGNQQVVSNCIFRNELLTAILDNHAVRGLILEWNHIENCGSGIYLQGPNPIVRFNTILRTWKHHSFRMESRTAFGGHIHNNTIRYARGGSFVCREWNMTDTRALLTVENNLFDQSEPARVGASRDEIGGGPGFDASGEEGSHAGTLARDVLFRNNVIDGHPSMKLKAVDNFEMFGNTGQSLNILVRERVHGRAVTNARIAAGQIPYIRYYFEEGPTSSRQATPEEIAARKIVVAA